MASQQEGQLTEMLQFGKDDLVEVASILGIVKEVGQIAEEVCRQETAGPIAQVHQEPVEENSSERDNTVVPASSPLVGKKLAKRVYSPTASTMVFPVKRSPPNKAIKCSANAKKEPMRNLGSDSQA